MSAMSCMSERSLDEVAALKNSLLQEELLQRQEAADLYYGKD
jgi:hypothetical protein